LENALEKLSNTQEQIVKQERLRALGMMAGGIAHDFNNALTMVLGYGELLLPWFQKEAPDSKEMAYVGHIIAAARDATHVVSRLRDFYRPAEADELRTALEVNGLCEQAIAFTTPKWKVKARAKGVNIEVVTALGEVQNVMGSGPELRESLTNLIFNAVDAMPNGGVLTIATHSNGGSVLIEVRDTGVGIPNENITKIFEPFFTTKEIGKGTGLGLAVCYGILTEHGGKLDVQSTPGVGTTFTISLPVISSDGEPQD